MESSFLVLHHLATAYVLVEKLKAHTYQMNLLVSMTALHSDKDITNSSAIKFFRRCNFVI